MHLKSRVPIVRLIAYTAFDSSKVVEDFHEIGHWAATKASLEDTNPAQNLIELAGRTCYQSYRNVYHPTFNPNGRDQRAYIQNLIRQGHLSVLEHASASFYIVTDRSVLAELSRHRHISLSVESQRYVDARDAELLFPDWILRGLRSYLEHWKMMTELLYEQIEQAAHARLPEQGLYTTDRRKAARQLARLVLPNATAVHLVTTGNLRAWYELLQKRCSPHADEGIRSVALEILKILRKQVAPLVFEHWVIHPPRWDGDPGWAEPTPLDAS